MQDAERGAVSALERIGGIGARAIRCAPAVATISAGLSPRLRPARRACDHASAAARVCGRKLILSSVLAAAGRSGGAPPVDPLRC